MLQEKHEKYKAEADARAQALTQEAQQLRDKIAASESEISSLQQHERSIRDQTETEKQHLRDEISSLNVGCPFCSADMHAIRLSPKQLYRPLCGIGTRSGTSCQAEVRLVNNVSL